MYLCNKEHFAFILSVQYIPVILGNLYGLGHVDLVQDFISLSVTFFFTMTRENAVSLFKE